jgi:glucosyl-dolichyl phosphate glucuronosyltransferase
VTEGFSIIIPTYNRATPLAVTLASLARLDVPKGFSAEIVVIDNNCTDDTGRVVEEYTRKMNMKVRRVVETQQGLNYCRNRGVQEGRFTNLVFFDDDIEAAPDWLHGFENALRDLSCDCVVGPVQAVFTEGVPDWMSPGTADMLSSVYSRKGNAPLVLPPETAHEIPGCNFGVRRQAAIDVGGFDNYLDRVGSALLAGGDFDFGQRLVVGNKRVVYHPQCRIRHLISSTKLSRPYMRRRAYGAGITTRIVERRTHGFEAVRIKRFVAAIARTAWRGIKAELRGAHAEAFEAELKIRHLVGYVWGGRRIEAAILKGRRELNDRGAAH